MTFTINFVNYVANISSYIIASYKNKDGFFVLYQ